jgi:hypothetical protein
MPLANVVHRAVPVFPTNSNPNAPGRTFKIVVLSEGFKKDELGAFATAVKESDIYSGSTPARNFEIGSNDRAALMRCSRAWWAVGSLRGAIADNRRSNVLVWRRRTVSAD